MAEEHVCRERTLGHVRVFLTTTTGGLRLLRFLGGLTRLRGEVRIYERLQEGGIHTLTLALVASFGICGTMVSFRTTNDTSRTRDQRAQRGRREGMHMWGKAVRRMEPSMAGWIGRGKVLGQTTNLEWICVVVKGLVDRGKGEGSGSDEGG